MSDDHWLEQIGNKKITDKDMELIVNVFKLMKTYYNKSTDDKEALLEMLDNALYNVTEIRNKIIKEL